MKELLYTILELEEWNKGVNCSFCSNLNNKAVCQIRTRSKLTDRILENDEVCEECKEKFENDELPKCSCGRLKTRYTCDCKEETQEKELPVLPDDRRPGAFYERQINALQEKLTTAEITIEEEREAHEDFMEKSEEWGKRQKQELLDKIAKLEKENIVYKEKVKQLEEENKKLVPEELTQKIKLYEKEIKELKEQMEQTAQIEIPAKDNKIKNFFKFGGKK